jgi:hypothetical protein
MSRHTSTYLAVSIAAALTVAASAALAAQSKARLDPANPEDALKIEQRLACSLDDGKPALYWFPGNVYSRVPGERDRLLFRVHGWSARACKTFNDPVRGYGYRAVNRELLVYEDPATGQILNTWKNPWTGETVDVMHVANDPVSMREPVFAKDVSGKPTPRPDRGFVLEGRHFTGGGAARLYYKNPLGGDYQENVGGWYHSMEMGSESLTVDDMLDGTRRDLGRRIGWMRASKWLPWMKMGDRAGFVYYHTAGGRVDSVEDLPEPFKTAMKTTFKLYLEAPPLDDTRPNMTSWDGFKRLVDGQKKPK